MRTNRPLPWQWRSPAAVKFSTQGYEAEDGVPDDRVAFIKRP